MQLEIYRSLSSIFKVFNITSITQQSPTIPSAQTFTSTRSLKTLTMLFQQSCGSQEVEEVIWIPSLAIESLILVRALHSFLVTPLIHRYLVTFIKKKYSKLMIFLRRACFKQHIFLVINIVNMPFKDALRLRFSANFSCIITSPQRFIRNERCVITIM